MTIDSGAMTWIVALCIGIITGIGWLIVRAVGMSIVITSMRKDIDRLEKDLTEEKTHNGKQHDELFSSRNETNVTLGRLTTLFENMDKKLDTLIERRA